MFGWAFIGFDAVPDDFDFAGEAKAVGFGRIELDPVRTFGVDVERLSVAAIGGAGEGGRALGVDEG